MSDSVITNEIETVKRKPRKTIELIQVEVEEEVIIESMKSPIPEVHIAKPLGGKKFVYFSSGSGYVTKMGLCFSTEKRIYEIDEDEANHLLSLDNFRLPDQLELEEFYKENS